MIVTVKYFTLFSQLTGKTEESVHLQEGATLGTLLTHLFAKYGKRFKAQFISGKERVPILLLNGTHADETAKLAHTDVVVIAYPVGGG